MKYLKSKVLKSYIIYNFLLILVPISILTTIFYLNLRKQLIAEVNHQQQYAMEHIKENIDRRINDFRVVSSRLSHSERVSPYTINMGGLSRMNAVEQIRSYHNLNDHFEEIMIYYKDQSLFIFNKGECPFSVLSESTYRAEGSWDNAAFQAFLDSTLTMRFSPEGGWLRDISSNKRYFVIAMPQPNYSSNPYGTLLGLIDYDTINQMIATLTGNLEGTAFIVNDQDEILFTSRNHFPLADQHIFGIVKNALSADLSEGEINGQDVSIIESRSSLTQWRYIMLIPKNQFQRTFFEDRWALLTTTIFIILAGILLGILVAYRNYKPIYRIKGFIPRQLETNKENEIESIGYAMQEISSNNAVLMQQVERSRVSRASNLVSYLVSGAQDVSDNEFIAQLESAGISLTDSDYCMAVLQFPRSLRTGEIEELSKSINLFSEGRALCFNLAIKRMIAVFLSMNKSDLIFHDHINELAELVNKIMSCQPRIGVGNICTKIERLNQSLMEAIAAAEATDKGEDQVIFFSQLKTWQEEGKYWYPAQAQLRLLQAIRHGNRAITDQAIQELSQQLFSKRAHVDDQMISFLTACITARTLQLADEINMPLDEYEISKLIYYGTLEEYMALFSQLCRSMLKHVEQQKKSLLFKQHEEIKAYIDEHFSDNNLSLGSIAEKFGMTASGLSRFFRENEGINFIDYLTNLRISAACELLVNTDLKVSDIVKQVGYLDLPNFTRKFTKIIGTSPGKYRTQRSS